MIPGTEEHNSCDTGRLARLSNRRLFLRGARPYLIPGFGETGRGCSSITALLECSSYSYEDVKMVVDVLQRAVLRKAREIRYLPLMA
jgi:hypothetical protein